MERIRVAIPDVWRERRHFVPRLVNCGGKTVLRSVRPGSNFKPTRPSYWSEVNSATATGMLPERDATMHPIVSGCRWTSSRSSAKGRLAFGRWVPRRGRGGKDEEVRLTALDNKSKQPTPTSALAPQECPPPVVEYHHVQPPPFHRSLCQSE